MYQVTICAVAVICKSLELIGGKTVTILYTFPVGFKVLSPQNGSTLILFSFEWNDSQVSFSSNDRT